MGGSQSQEELDENQNQQQIQQTTISEENQTHQQNQVPVEESSQVEEINPLQILSEDDYKYGNVYQFKGIIKYGDNESKPKYPVLQLSQISNKENLWLTNEQDSSGQHSPINSHSHSNDYSQLGQSIEDITVTENLNSSKQQLSNDTDFNTDLTEQILHSSKRETPYRVDKTLLFDLNILINYKPQYLY